ncbi:hypothetical protein FACS189429_7490 [Bacteroidia bacterium]|nr:hypothetical protein FACS189429_7490 [Bacteroidia bacterium]
MQKKIKDMETVLLTYNAQNENAVQMLKIILALGLFQVKNADTNLQHTQVFAENTETTKLIAAEQMPKEYISLEEFRQEGHKLIHKFCVENGIN